MFKKQFKLKSQVQLKSTEKKKLVTEMKKYFPGLSDEENGLMFSNKEDIIKSKITSFTDENIEVYYVDKVPMFFDIVDSNIVLPTVFMIWKFPKLVPILTTSNFVFEKLKNGADLFLPGVILEGLSFNDNCFNKSDVVSLNLIDNKCCVGIGQALMSQKDIPMDVNKMSGKVAKLYHTVGDFLYKQHPTPVLPTLGPPDWALEEESVLEENDKEAESLIPETESTEDCDVVSSEQTNICDSEDVPEIVEDNSTYTEELSETEKMSNLLEYCFLKAVKTLARNAYPILPATFYANHILTNLPPDETLNIKKTKWKKFSTFLQDMSIVGLVNLEEIRKNEYRIVGINVSHPKIKSFVDIHEGEPKRVEDKVGSNGQPVIQQVYTVSAATLIFFEKHGYKKKDELTRNDVRNHLNDYIKSENLTTDKDKVVLDPILYGILKKEIVNRVELLSGILEKMSVEHKISNVPTGTIIHKGKLPYIEFEVVTRAGNKKVTLISNLESYGIDVNSFSKELQQAAAASTTVTSNVPGKKGPQVQVQGNQIHIAMKILHEKNHINEKHMRGLEKAVKKKK